jgi:biotin-(acetyl-CoA carboxylase) ligase
VFKAAPLGVMFDTPAQIKTMAARIKYRAYELGNMPFNNKTGITPTERAPAAAPSRNRVAAAVLAHWLPALAQFDAEGLAPFLARYAGFDALAGRDVVVHQPEGARPARALGLAADGALRVQLDGREQRLHAGEISVRGA